MSRAMEALSESVKKERMRPLLRWRDGTARRRISGGRSRLTLRSMQKGSIGDFVTPSEVPATPTRPSNQHNVDLDELSPGILDLYSFDTELLPEMLVHEARQGGNAWGRSFNDAGQRPKSTTSATSSTTTRRATPRWSSPSPITSPTA